MVAHSKAPAGPAACSQPVGWCISHEALTTTAGAMHRVAPQRPRQFHQSPTSPARDADLCLVRVLRQRLLHLHRINVVAATYVHVGRAAHQRSLVAQQGPNGTVLMDQDARFSALQNAFYFARTESGVQAGGYRIRADCCGDRHGIVNRRRQCDSDYITCLNATFNEGRSQRIGRAQPLNKT